MIWKKQRRASSEDIEGPAVVDAPEATEGAIEPSSGDGREVDEAAGRAGGVRSMARAAVPALIAAAFAELLRSRYQHSHMFLPEKYPTGVWEPRTYGVQAEDVWFESSDGTGLHGWWIPSRRARGTLLYCHGNAGNISNRIGVYRFLRRLQVNVLTFDYRGYGRSEGKPSERGLYLDAQSAHDYLTETVGEDAERILLFGHSLGGAVAIDLATKRPAAGLMVQSSFTDLRQMAKVRFPGFPMYWIARNHFRSRDKVPHIHMPKLFIHGTQDETVPFDVGEQLYEAAADPKDWYAVPHAGHNDVYRFGGVRYLWRLVRFSRRCLAAARKDGLAQRPVSPP